MARAVDRQVQVIRIVLDRTRVKHREAGPMEEALTALEKTL